MNSNSDPFTTISELESKLNAERILNNNSTWSKLDKSTKINKLLLFANKYNCCESDKIKLIDCLKKALEQNKLQKIKEVVYNIDKNEIIDIPALLYIDGTFILKNEKRISTTKSLPVKNKCHNTKKKKHKIDNKE